MKSAKYLSEKFDSRKDEINRLYRGRSRKIRLMVTELTYALGLLEEEAGAEDVRQNWCKLVDRMWSSRRGEVTTAREHLLMTVAMAEEKYFRHLPVGGWKKPRNRKTTFLLQDANGKRHYIDQEQPHADEAAEEALKFLAGFDPELAEKVAVSDIEKILSVWRDRHRNAGRAGKQHRIDEELCALIKKLGYGPITSEAMRRQRLKWEKTWPWKSLDPPEEERGAETTLN